MAKRKTTAQLVEQAATLLQKLVRMQAADEYGICTCVSCGKRAHWKTMDGGHWISRTYSIYKLAAWNINPQCKTCNRFDHRSHHEYTLYMIDRHGDENVRSWITNKHQLYKHDRQEIINKIAAYRHAIKVEEERLG